MRCSFIAVCACVAGLIIERIFYNKYFGSVVGRDICLYCRWRIKLKFNNLAGLSYGFQLLERKLGKHTFGNAPIEDNRQGSCGKNLAFFFNDGLCAGFSVPIM